MRACFAVAPPGCWRSPPLRASGTSRRRKATPNNPFRSGGELDLFCRNENPRCKHFWPLIDLGHLIARSLTKRAKRLDRLRFLAGGLPHAAVQRRCEDKLPSLALPCLPTGAMPIHATTIKTGGPRPTLPVVSIGQRFLLWQVGKRRCFLVADPTADLRDEQQ